MSLKFNEAKVYGPIKDLVHCFNSVANTPYIDLPTVANAGQALYKMITPEDTATRFPVGLSVDDENYLRFQFLNTATRVTHGIHQVGSIEQFTAFKSNELFQALVDQKIVIPANKSGIFKNARKEKSMTTNMTTFDETRVSSDVKTLAHCFNLVANTKYKNDVISVLDSGKELYNQITGQSKAPAIFLSYNDERYLKFPFLEVASKLQPGPYGVTSVAKYIVAEAEDLFTKAVKRKIIVPISKT